MISLASINKQYGRQLIFVDASFQLNPGEKVGLVGPNGAGKTTLFRMIVGEEVPDEGEVTVPKRTTIGYFRQDVEEMAGRIGKIAMNYYETDQGGYDALHAVATRFADLKIMGS